MIGPAICELENVPCTHIVLQSYTTSIVRGFDHIELEGGKFNARGKETLT
jgi:hypothetical protein